MPDLSSARCFPALTRSESVRLLSPVARFVLRGGPAVLAAAGAALGFKLSEIACRSASQGERAALWLGPDEQLLLAPVADGEAIARQLRDSLATLPHSLVDVSHRQIAIEVGGPRAQQVLNAGCPLDLHTRSFPVGMCTRTVLGKCEIVLWRRDTATFHVEVWRSFVAYASRFLAEAGETL